MPQPARPERHAPTKAPAAPRRRSAKGDTRYGRQELHVASDASARNKKKKRVQGTHRPGSVSSETRHGFEMPTAPMKREVTIGETITPQEIAQKMAVKATEVIKTMMNMGVMATINQPIDQDTAILIVEEMGHTAKALKADQVEEDLQGESARRRPNRRVRPSSPSWATSTTARPRCSTTSAARKWRRVKPAASRSTSARTTWKRRRA